MRIGNAARQQLQLDIHGAIVLAAHEYVRRRPGGLGTWSGRLLAGIGEQVCRLWQRPDQGIWEIRAAPRRHVYSAAMCAVALERLVDLARAGELRLSAAQGERFTRAGREIRLTIEQRGWCDALGSYTSVLDGRDVDASLLLLGLHGYVEWGQPRMQATFERVRAELGEGGLLLRYRPQTDDGLPAGEGAFAICSFWVVEHLARTGRVCEAEEELVRLCGYANDVGLFAEQIDPASGAALGNFPQAFSHVGLVSAALALAEARGADVAEAGLGAPRPPGRSEERRVEELHGEEDPP